MDDITVVDIDGDGSGRCGTSSISTAVSDDLRPRGGDSGVDFTGEAGTSTRGIDSDGRVMGLEGVPGLEVGGGCGFACDNTDTVPCSAIVLSADEAMGDMTGSLTGAATSRTD